MSEHLSRLITDHFQPTSWLRHSCWAIGRGGRLRQIRTLDERPARCASTTHSARIASFGLSCLYSLLMPAFIVQRSAFVPALGWYVSVATGLLWLSGCTLSGQRDAGPSTYNPEMRTDPSLIERTAFSAVSVRVHPLTHIDPQAGTNGNQVLLLLHFELRDRFAEQVRDLGVLRVEFTAPGQQPISWDVPEMLDAGENVKRYDSSTRTYRLGLTLPPALHAARGGVVKVTFHMPHLERTLTHEYTLGSTQR